MSSVDDVPPVPKVEPFDEDDFSDDSQEPDGLNHAQEIAQVQKRKGGRKPVSVIRLILYPGKLTLTQIYATSEERKQRNRQAQAAFRERRTEYIKQLETTITQHEETLQSLQQSHRSAADECLMLRYKNSLLERILLEKGEELSGVRARPCCLADSLAGIDVQAELRMKTEGSHVLSQPASTAAAAQPSAVQRAVMNRHNQARRTTSASSGKPLRPQHNNQNPPPRSHSMTSHVNSPIVMKSPYGSGKSGMMPDGKAQSRHQQSLQPRTHPPPNVNQPRMPPTGASLQAMTPSTADSSRSSDVGSNPVSQAGFYPSPYQAHLEQLGKLEIPLLDLGSVIR